MINTDPFASGELLLHHRYERGSPITCGAPHGCITAVVDDVRCPKCREILGCQGLTEAQVDQFVMATCGRTDAHSEHPGGDTRGR